MEYSGGLVLLHVALAGLDSSMDKLLEAALSGGARIHTYVSGDLAVRWYLASRLDVRDLTSLMAWIAMKTCLGNDSGRQITDVHP